MISPEKPQRARNMVRVDFDHTVEFVGDDPAAFADFLRMKFERAGEGTEHKNLDEFMAGFGAGGKFQQRPERQRSIMPAKFLAQFAPGGGDVILPRIEMAAAGGIPASGKRVLAHASPLKEEMSGRIVNQDVHRAVQQFPGVDFAPGRLSDDTVFGIDDIEKLVGIGGTVKLHFSL